MQTIKLTPEDKRLLGKVTGKEDVAIICDSTNAAFSVDLYDASMATGVNFYIKNIGINDVTVNSPTGQYIDDAWSITLKQWDCCSVLPFEDKWLIIGASSGRLNYKWRITPEGGIAHKYINGTGAPSVKGTVVRITGNNTVDGIVVNIPDPIGVIYENNVANGSEVWVVTEGKAECLVIGTCTYGQLARGFVSSDAGYVKGSLICEAVPSSPFATDKHFYEFGHVNTGRTGAGLAMIQIHKN
jgi:hypothetical protein